MAKNNNTDIYSILASQFVPEQTLTCRAIVSTSEKGVNYKANVSESKNTAVFQVDGYILTAGNKCDKLVLAQQSLDQTQWVGCFVELKGGDISHAILQLEQTISHHQFKHETLIKKLARVVGRSFPSNAGNPDFEKARIRFRNKYQCELKRLKSGQADNL